MDNFSYNYNDYPENYQYLTNSDQDIQQNYISNDIQKSYPFYQIKTYDREKLGQNVYNNIYYPQTIFYRNDINALNFYDEDYYGVSYSKDIYKNIQNIQKVPKDTNRIPQDNIKNKTNYINAHKYSYNDPNKKLNNITTINNNNYNKINSINIIFDANNNYNNDYNKYNNFNDINLMNNYNNQKLYFNGQKKETNKEKQPEDNYKKYSDSLNQSNTFSNHNNSNIKVETNEIKNISVKNNSYIPIKKIENNNNYPKNTENNKKIIISKKEENCNNNINNKSNALNNDKSNQIEITTKNIEFNNKRKTLKPNTINKIEKLNNNRNTITNIQIKEKTNNKDKKNEKNDRVSKYMRSPNSHKNINKIFNSNIIITEKEKEKIKDKKNEKETKTKKLRQTKSYINKNKYIFPHRRNTYQSNELNKNYSFNLPTIRSHKSKEKEKSNFASLINEKKKKMLSSIKHIDTFDRTNHKGEISKYLTYNKDDIIYEKRRKIKKVEKYKLKNKSNLLDDKDKKTKMKKSTNQIKDQRLYTPQFSSNNLNKNKNKEIINNIKKKTDTKLPRNISYNISFNSKKKKLFNKKIELSTPKSLATHNSRKKNNSKFRTLNHLEYSNKKSIFENENSNKYLKTEQNDEKLVNLLSSKKINKIQSDKNVLELKNKNAQKSFNTRTSDYHLSKKTNNQEKKDFSIKKVINSKNNSNNKTIKNNLSIKNSSDIKNEKKKKINSNNTQKPKTARITSKKLLYSKNKERGLSGSLNQKKNLYTFSKKTQKRSNSLRHNIFAEDKKDFSNSFRGFSACKKLEHIKNKYKFRPKTKDKKISIKDKNINYIEESKGFAKLISSADFFHEKDSLEEEKSELNNSKSNKDEKEIENENSSFINEDNDNDNDNNKKSKDMNDNDNENENDILNNKSFILDLNNVIPINEKEINNINMLSMNISKSENVQIGKDIKDNSLINSLSLQPENFKEKNNEKEETKNNEKQEKNKENYENKKSENNEKDGNSKENSNNKNNKKDDNGKEKPNEGSIDNTNIKKY